MNRVSQFIQVRPEAVSQAKLRILLGLYDDDLTLDAALDRMFDRVLESAD